MKHVAIISADHFMFMETAKEHYANLGEDISEISINQLYPRTVKTKEVTYHFVKDLNCIPVVLIDEITASTEAREEMSHQLYEDLEHALFNRMKKVGAKPKELISLSNDSDALISVYDAFRILTDEPNGDFNMFRENIKDPETISLLNAILLTAKALNDHGYYAKSE